MKLAMTTAAVLAATTLVEGVNLRRSGAQVRALSAAQTMTVNRLAAKYDCHDATGDLVTTIHNVVAANDQEGTRLKGECDAKITKHRADWTTATDLYNTEFDKIVPEETATETTKKNAANTQFSSVEDQWCVEGFVMDGYAGCGTTLGASVLPPKKAKDTADSEATDAIAAYDAAFKLHDEEETQSIADRKAMSNKIDGEKTTAKSAMDVAFTTAEGERAKGISAAETTQTEQKAECQQLFDERSAHISSDTNLLSKLKPLLEQLNICKNSKHKMFGAPKRKWYKGADGSTCDQTCAKVSQEVGVSLVCNAGEQTALNSQAKVGAAFAEAGYECKGYHAARDYQGTPFSTGRNDDCAPFIHDSNLKSTCDSNSYDHHAPLCACTVAGSSFLEVSTEARCAAVRSKTMSLLEINGDPMGSYHDFEVRVISETAHMNAQKKSCDDDTTSNFETTKNEYLTNEQKSKDDAQNAYDSLVETVNKQLAKFIEDETAHVKTLFDGMKAKEGTKNSKVEVQATKDAEFQAKVTEGKAAMSVAVIDKIDAMESAKATKEVKIATRKANLITGNQNKKREIDTLSAHDKEYCDDAKNNLVAESNIIKQMLDVLNTGGDGGSGLRVVKDEVDGNMHSALDEAGTIAMHAGPVTAYKLDFSGGKCSHPTTLTSHGHRGCPGDFGDHVYLLGDGGAFDGRDQTTKAFPPQPDDHPKGKFRVPRNKELILVHTGKAVDMSHAGTSTELLDNSGLSNWEFQESFTLSMSFYVEESNSFGRTRIWQSDKPPGEPAVTHTGTNGDRDANMQFELQTMFGMQGRRELQFKFAKDGHQYLAGLNLDYGHQNDIFRNQWRHVSIHVAKDGVTFLIDGKPAVGQDYVGRQDAPGGKVAWECKSFWVNGENLCQDGAVNLPDGPFVVSGKQLFLASPAGYEQGDTKVSAVQFKDVELVGV